MAHRKKGSTDLNASRTLCSRARFYKDWRHERNVRERERFSPKSKQCQPPETSADEARPDLHKSRML